SEGDIANLYPIDKHTPQGHAIPHTLKDPAVDGFPARGILIFMRTQEQVGILTRTLTLKPDHKILWLQFTTGILQGSNEEIVQVFFPVINLNNGQMGIFRHQLIGNSSLEMDVFGA